MNFKAIDFRFVALGGLLWNKVRVYLEENVLERSTKVGAVDLRMARRFGIVEIFAFGAVELDTLGMGDVG